MEDFKIGFYKRSDFKSIILAVAINGNHKVGFIFDSKNYSQGYFNKTWGHFDVIREDFHLSETAIKELLLSETAKPYLEELRLFFHSDILFSFDGRFLESDDEIISLDSISRIKKIDDTFIEINIFGEIRKIQFKEHSKLLKAFKKEDL